MALAAHHLGLGLPRLVFKSRPLALDPTEFADHRQPHGLCLALAVNVDIRPAGVYSFAFCV
jgi:hypothetical protein